MQISVVRPGDLGPADIAAWHEMQRTTPALASPFLSPEFAVAVGRFRPSARVAVLTDGPSTVGFFPFERRRLGMGVPIGAGLTDCQGLIHSPGAEWDARELLRACQLSVWEFDHMVEGQRAFDGYRVATRPSPFIDLGSGFDSYYEMLKLRAPQFGRNVERKSRKMAREAGELSFVADSHDVAAFRSLLMWKSDQYRRTAQVDIFARPWTAQLIEALFDTRGSEFGGLLSVLYAGDVPVAAHFGLRSGPVLAHWFPAYDTSFSKYSPGLILHVRLAQHTPAAGVRLIDLGTGAMRYKEELKSGDLFVGQGVVTRRSVLAGVHMARSSATQWAVRTVKQHPSAFELAGWLRKHLRAARVARGGTPLPEAPEQPGAY